MALCMGGGLVPLLLCACGGLPTARSIRAGVAVAEEPGAGGGAYPASWDSSFGRGQVAMDALLYPDPSAPAEVFANARLQCLDGPHVMIVGSQVRDHMAQSGLEQFDCRFRGPGSQTLEEPGWFYPDASRACAGRLPNPQQYKGEMDNTLVCKVPLALLENTSVSQVDVTLARRHGDPFSHRLAARGLVDDSTIRGSTAASTSRRYRLVVTNMYKNAGARIANWLEWHIAKGVEHFFLYDNGSGGEDRAHLEPFEKRGLVTRIPWLFCCAGSMKNNLGQRGTLNHALMKYGQVSEWMISLDQDEFLVSPSSQSSIPEMLNALNSSVPGVGVGHSLLVMRMCDGEGGRAGELGVEMGSMNTSSRCPPRLSNWKYPGKFFVRPSHAHRVGFLYTTPHPFGRGLPDRMEKSVAAKLNLELDKLDIAIAHFRSDAPSSADVCQRNCEMSSQKVSKKQAWLQHEYDALLHRTGKL